MGFKTGPARLVDDLDFLVEDLAVGFADGEFGLTEIELVSLDLLNGTEVDDIGPVDAEKVRREEGVELLQGEEAHYGLALRENEGRVIPLGFDVEKFGKVDPMNGITVFEEEGVFVAGGL